ncbi:MAG: copper chaperone [Bacteroidetes bacterium]|nr:copper chaperone [Bacteroidota bacterium]
MKTIIILFGLLCSMNIKAQTIITSTISVKGNCGECKDRIENAADIKGVKTSNWDKDKKILTVTYDTGKVTLAQIESAIAKAGHATASQKADAKAYTKLPNCCKYEHGECKEPK